MKAEIEVLGRMETVEITTNAQKIFRGPYRYIGTDFDAECDIYENEETGEFLGLVSQLEYME